MGTYTTYDFVESVPDVAAVETVIAAWGESTEGYGEWSGGFLLRLKDGTYSYVTGWCDTSGWGCQDGRDEQKFPAQPALASLGVTAGQGAAAPGVIAWDLDPADLNKWLAGERKDPWL